MSDEEKLGWQTPVSPGWDAPTVEDITPEPVCTCARCLRDARAQELKGRLITVLGGQVIPILNEAIANNLILEFSLVLSPGVGYAIGQFTCKEPH